jgi:hypothetical protein
VAVWPSFINHTICQCVRSTALVALRYRSWSSSLVNIILTSNKSYGEWGDVVSDYVLATAMLDRLLHYSTTINIRGESYRLREKRRAGVFHDLTAKPVKAGPSTSRKTPGWVRSTSTAGTMAYRCTKGGTPFQEQTFWGIFDWHPKMPP